MKFKSSLLSYFILTAFMCLANIASAQVVVVTSTEDSPWKVTEIQFLQSQPAGSEITELFPDKPEQMISGFGGCFNELGWEALQMLSADKQQNILNSLFNTADGCGLTYCRLPMGANDYSVDWYSNNETANDFRMKHFSIERDHERLIPYIKAARSVQPSLRLWASPWCPPSWMKTNNHYACTPTKFNGLDPAKKGEEMKTQFIMEKNYLLAYALYFTKFAQAYKNEGLPIEAVQVQNEPNSCQVFPSCIWRPEDLALFIGDYLGPQFAKEKLSTEIWLGTIERPQFDRVSVILNNEKAGQYIKGTGFQWAGKGAIAEVHKNYPELQLMQSETECGDGSNDWKSAEYTFSLMDHYFKAGANAYMFWNMILKKDGISYWGWKQNAMISVDSTGNFRCNPEFYVMKHFSHSIKPGGHKLKTSGDDHSLLAFRNPDGSIVVVCSNPKDTSREFIFKCRNKMFRFSGLPHSFNTLIMQD